MPHERMLQYRIAYEMVPAMQRLGEKELADTGHLRALSTSGGPLNAGEKLAAPSMPWRPSKSTMTLLLGMSRFLLSRMRGMGLRLNKNFVVRGVREAGGHYVGCLSAPRLPPLPSGGSLASLTLE